MVALQAQENNCKCITVTWFERGKLVSKELELSEKSQKQFSDLSEIFSQISPVPLFLRINPPDGAILFPNVVLPVSITLQDDVLLQCGLPQFEELAFFAPDEYKKLYRKKNWIIEPIVDEKSGNCTALGICRKYEIEPREPLAIIEPIVENEAGLQAMLNLNMFYIAQALKEKNMSNCVDESIENRTKARKNTTDALAGGPGLAKPLLHLTLFYAGYANSEQQKEAAKSIENTQKKIIESNLSIKGAFG